MQAGKLEELWQLLLEVAVAESAVAYTLGSCWKTQQLLAIFVELSQVGMVGLQAKSLATEASYVDVFVFFGEPWLPANIIVT
jgi:hypothetical protein